MFRSTQQMAYARRTFNEWPRETGTGDDRMTLWSEAPSMGRTRTAWYLTTSGTFARMSRFDYGDGRPPMLTPCTERAAQARTLAETIEAQRARLWWGEPMADDSARATA